MTEKFKTYKYTIMIKGNKKMVKWFNDFILLFFKAVDMSNTNSKKRAKDGTIKFDREEIINAKNRGYKSW